MIQDEIRRVLAALPAGLDPRYSVATKQVYAPLQASALDGVTVSRDVAYGPHERHKLDVYRVAGRRPRAS